MHGHGQHWLVSSLNYKGEIDPLEVFDDLQQAKLGAFKRDLAERSKDHWMKPVNASYFSVKPVPKQKGTEGCYTFAACAKEMSGLCSKEFAVYMMHQEEQMATKNLHAEKNVRGAAFHRMTDIGPVMARSDSPYDDWVLHVLSTPH